MSRNLYKYGSGRRSCPDSEQAPGLLNRHRNLPSRSSYPPQDQRNHRRLQIYLQAVSLHQFLQAKAPKLPPRAETNPFLKGKRALSDTEVSRFNRYVRAVFRPDTVLTSMRNNALTSEEVEAVRTVYPQMYNMITDFLTENAAKLTTSLPYAKRLSLSTWLGVPLDETVPLTQQLQANTTAQPEQPQGPQPRGVDVQLPEGTRTPTQEVAVS